LKKGINAWCFSEDIDAETLFRKVKDLGFEGIELNLSEDNLSILHMKSTKEEIIHLKEYAQSFGIKILGISTDLLWKYPLTSNDRNVQIKGMNIVEKMIEAASLSEAKTVLVVPGIVTAEVPYDAAYKKSLESIKSLAKIAEKQQVKIGIENVWNKFLLSPLEMAEFIDQVDSSSVGAYLDIGNTVQFGYPEQWINILSERIMAVHIKDFKQSVGNIDGFVTLLAGDISWDKVSKALNEIHYTGFISPEIPPHPHHSDWQLKMISDTMDLIFQFD
jgi:L-ribulose-5-phosphate 3-epimerase